MAIGSHMTHRPRAPGLAAPTTCADSRRADGDLRREIDENWYIYALKPIWIWVGGNVGGAIFFMPDNV